MYEHKSKAPLRLRAFRRRLLNHTVAALAIIAAALAIGMSGYHFIAGFNWVDSLLESSMILGGMGPIKELPNDSAKLFASFFALFSGLVFIGTATLMIAPLAHRLLHKFHWEESKDS